MPRNKYLNSNSKMPACDSAEAVHSTNKSHSLTANFSHFSNPIASSVRSKDQVQGVKTSLKEYMPMKSIKCLMKRWCGADSYSGY